uniref:ABC transporter n=1 Tax=Streptomyces roseoverticillatus TaxID=66429 RepID=A0A0S3TVU5_9ACTN|nr:ABC transporter [Streptomyces roseoverticillatus]
MRNLPSPDMGTPDVRSPARYLTWLVRKHWQSVLLGLVYGVLCMLGQALVPAAVGRAVDEGLAARDQDALVYWGGAVLLLGVVQAVTGILRDRASRAAALGASYLTMQHITRQAARLGATLPRKVSAGEVVSTGVADITQIGGALESTARGGGGAVAIVAVSVIMLTASWELGLVVLVGVPLMAWATALLLRPLHRHQRSLRDEQERLNTRAVDIASGLRVLRGVGGEEAFARRYREESQRVRRAGVRVARVEALIDGAKVLLPGLLVAFVVWLGARYVLDGRLSPGQLVAFYGYAAFLTNPLRRLTDTADRTMKGYVAADRVVRLLSLEPALSSGPLKPGALDGAATLEDPASGLTVEPGRLAAVVCATPEEAAELADRLGRFTDSGAVYGGVPLRDLPLEEVRRRILVADNDAYLFSGPLRETLSPRGGAAEAAADSGGDGAWDRALAAASARDIVEALPDGPDAQVIGAGREFSGGQQQRLRLVRALLADPEVLVLVEPTSAVDAHTEARVADGLAAVRAHRSTVVFTTSPVVLDRADHVAYVEDRAVEAEGTHRELLTHARYRAVVAREDPV